jgi:hypothetical protein
VVRALAFPLEQQLVGDVDHAVEHLTQRGRAERGHQDPVRLAPVRLLGPRGEQPVAGEVAHLQQRPGQGLVEAGLVADLVDQLLRADEDDVPAGQLEAEDRAQLLGQLHDPEDALVGVDVRQVAQQGDRPRLRDGHDRRRHADLRNRAQNLVPSRY